MALERQLTPEENAFLGECYKQNHTQLYNIAMSSLRNPHLAYDIVQDALAHAAECIEEFMNSESPSGWVRRAMDYRILHALRTRSKLLARNIPLEEAYDLAGDDGDIAINELDTESKDMQLMIRYFEYGYSLQKIADEWNITVGAVKMRIQRAKRRLQNDADVNDLKNFYF